MERIKINYIHKDKFNRTKVLISRFRKFSEKLIDVEADFLEELFSDSELTYKQIYHKHEPVYKALAEEFHKNSTNCITVNVDYFEQHYYYVEGKR